MANNTHKFVVKNGLITNNVDFVNSVSNPTNTVGVSTDASFLNIDGNVKFGDNDELHFGASSDLKIVHDGSNSRIIDGGTGNLILQGQNVSITNTLGTETFASFINDGAVNLNFNGSQKLATTNTGVDVTGTVTADGLSLSGEIELAYNDPKIKFTDTAGGGQDDFSIFPNSSNLFIYDETSSKRIAGFGSDGDVFFYEDTGTTPKFFWDASEETLLVGKTVRDSTTAGAYLNETFGGVIVRDGGNPLLLNRLTSDGDIAVFRKDGSTVGSIGVESSDNFYIGATSGGGAGLYMWGAAGTTPYISPMKESSIVDAEVTLGRSNERFKDLHLSGTAYAGGLVVDGEASIDVAGTNFKLVSDSSSRITLEWLQGSSRRWTLDLQADADLNFVSSDANDKLRVNDNQVFTDGYHPNADKWTTARTLSLTGDVTGSTSWDGSGNASITATVANDSHTHDGRYYTESEADSRFVNASGDTMTGDLVMSSNQVNFKSSGSSTVPQILGHRSTVDLNSRFFNDEGGLSYTTFDTGTSNAPGDISNNANGLLTINTHTGGYNHQLAFTNQGALYHRSKETTNTRSWERVFTTGYHPNADKWTTARTLSLTGDVTGSVSWDGSGNASLSATVANDSHTHDTRYVRKSGDTMTGALEIINDTGLDIKTATNGAGAQILFSDNVGSSYAQQGFIRYFHSDGAVSSEPQTSTDGFIIGGTETNTVVRVQGDVDIDQDLNVNNDMYIADQIIHIGDTDTYTQFHAADQWRVVTGGTERLEVTNDTTTLATNLQINSHAINMDMNNTNDNAIEIREVRDSTWAFQFVTNDVGNDNHSGFWVGNTGYPDMRLRRDDGTVRALISSHERSYVPNGFSINGSTLDMNNNDIVGVDAIIHEGDTDTYIQFHAADQWRVVTGGTERLEVNNNEVQIPGELDVGIINLSNEFRVPFNTSTTDVTITASSDQDTGFNFTQSGEVRFVSNGTNRVKFNNTGLDVTGLLTATQKSFTIDHPTKEGHKLRYGSLEGPENGVYARGKLQGEDTIELPEYWTKLVDPDSITVQLTGIGKGQYWVEDIVDNKVIIGSDTDNIKCFYMINAERVDVDKLEVEFEA